MTDLPPPPDTPYRGEPAPKPEWWKRRWVHITAGVVVALLVLGAIFGEEEADDEAAEMNAVDQTTTAPDAEPEPTEPTTTEAPATTAAPTTTEPAVDEALEFLDHALSEMELMGSSARWYITGEAEVTAHFLIVEAQLNRSDTDQASQLCGSLVSSSYSYSGEMSWRVVQIQPIDGGVAAECERRTG